MNAGKEVRVVADRRRQLEAAGIGAMNEARAQRLVTGMVRAVGVENLADPAPQGEPRVAAEREQRVECRAGCRARGFRSGAIEQPEFKCRGEIEDVVADGDAAARACAARREHAERQVLDRKVGVLVRRSDPASPPG